MGPNSNRALKLLEQLAQLGVKTIGLCPGARNAPFVSLLSQSVGFEVISFYDERSAGFFAIGRIKRDLSPVAVITTSGTAVSELLSSVIEAFYSDLPLIVVSADRPRALRGTGAPQTIDQTSIFSKSVEKSWDIAGDEAVQVTFSGSKPIHINMCFDEPLIDTSISEKIIFSAPPVVKTSSEDQSTVALSETVSPLETFLRQNKINLVNPLIVISGLNSEEAENVASLLIDVDLPLYAETLSGLRQIPHLRYKLLKGGERSVSRWLKSGEVKSLVRIGDVPLGRYWREVDQLGIPVVSLSSKAFPGSDRSFLFQTDLTKKFFHSNDFMVWNNQQLRCQDKINSEETLKIAINHNHSEPGMILQLIEQIKTEDAIYVGNSLPVRWLDLLDHKHSSVLASRGVNGIDGQLSTAFGLAKSNQTLWVLLGDLTTLYDFSAFWLTEKLLEYKAQVNIVVINNKGGQIFSRLFKEELFLNRHNLEFEKMASFWGWNYQKATSPFLLDSNGPLNFYELLPDEKATAHFWKDYDQIWKN